MNRFPQFRSKLIFPSLLALLTLSVLSNWPLSADDPETPADAVAVIESMQLGDVKNLHRCGTIWISGQPTKADFALLKEQGITCVVTFRTDGEIDWDEADVVAKQGMEFKKIPYASTDSLTKEVYAQTREILRAQESKPILLHCGAAPRVLAVWLAYRVLDQHVPLQQAQEEAEKMGLRSKALLEKTLEYIRDEQTKSSL